MPRSKTRLEYNTFVKGLITEASPLTFPDNASLVDENFVLNKDGSRQRRLGIRYEIGHVNTVVGSIEGTTLAITSFSWKSVNNDGNIDIAVFQNGNVLQFFDNNVSPITGSPLNQGNTLTVGTTTDIKYSFTESYGKLIVATGDEDVTILEYDAVNDIVSKTTYRLKVRDTFGVTENPLMDVDERITELEPVYFGLIAITDTHNYNLRNQGWPDSAECATNAQGSADPVKRDPVSHTGLNAGFWPSNADLFSTGKIASATRISAINSFSPWELEKSFTGTAQAPRGHFLLDLFSRGADRGIIQSGLGNDETQGGVNSVASYAGRLFYSIRVDSTNGTDDNTPDLGSMIFFSQSTENKLNYGSCYAQSDPTALDINDPLATDGGFITIPDAGQIYKLATLGQSLFVFTSKGIWEVSGGESFFSATNQTVSKVTDFGIFGATSVVSGEASLSFWATGGIYVIQIDPTSLRGVATNITQNTVQSEYDEIDFVAKQDVVGVYDIISKQFRWLYREGTLASNSYYNRELIFDTTLQAFYKNIFSELTMAAGSSPYLIGYLSLSSLVFTDDTESVLAAGDGQVQVLGDDVVSSIRTADQSTESSTKYWSLRDLGTGSANCTVSGLVNLDFIDWEDETDTGGNDGGDAQAQLLTGYLTDQDATTVKKNKYVTVFCKRTETGFTDDGSGNLTPVNPSSCLIQGQWEWTDSAAAGRWTNEQEAYRLPRPYVPTGAGDPFDYSFTVVKTKNKLRGKGSALSILFKSSPLKDLHLYGWARDVTVPEN